MTYDRRRALLDMQHLLDQDVPAEEALDRAARAHAGQTPYETVRSSLGDMLDWAFGAVVDLDSYIADEAAEEDIFPEDYADHPRIPQAFIDLDSGDALACVHYALQAQRSEVAVADQARRSPNVTG